MKNLNPVSATAHSSSGMERPKRRKRSRFLLWLGFVVIMGYGGFAIHAWRQERQKKPNPVQGEVQPAQRATATLQAQQEQLNLALVEAVRVRDIQKVLALLDAGADPNASALPIREDTEDAWERSASFLRKPANAPRANRAFHLAFWSEENGIDLADTRLIQALVEHGAKLSLYDTKGLTPLHCAAFKRRPDLVRLLVRYGADLNAPSLSDGGTPLHEAAKDPPTANTLLGLGADPLLPDKDGITFVHEYVGNNSANIESVLSRLPDIDLPDKAGDTPLHHATAWGAENNIRQLLRHGADPTCQNHQGETPLDYARANHREYHTDHSALVLNLLEEAAKRHTQAVP